MMEGARVKMCIRPFTLMTIRRHRHLLLGQFVPPAMMPKTKLKMQLLYGIGATGGGGRLGRVIEKKIDARIHPRR